MSSAMNPTLSILSGNGARPAPPCTLIVHVRYEKKMASCGSNIRSLVSLRRLDTSCWQSSSVNLVCSGWLGPLSQIKDGSRIRSGAVKFNGVGGKLERGLSSLLVNDDEVGIVTARHGKKWNSSMQKIA